jgi:general secretion pathway protein E
MQPVIERNVLTVEDPVEYRVPVACQTEVNRRAGYEFATAMRHFLRHDPDIILVGEIRDSETARAALDASSTGHLVLSTLHGRHLRRGAAPKLLGVDNETIAENLVAVLNQRLVRRICPHCRSERAASQEEQDWQGAGAPDPVPRPGLHALPRPGYLGRVPVYELLIVQREMADAIAAARPRGALRELAERGGLRPILDLSRQRAEPATPRRTRSSARWARTEGARP